MSFKNAKYFIVRYLIINSANVKYFPCPCQGMQKNDKMKRNFGPLRAYILGGGYGKRLTISQINKINRMLQMTYAAEKNEAGSGGYLKGLIDI